MNEFNALRLITGLFPPSFFGTRNKLLRNWLSFEWTRWMAPFLSIACTSWVINSDTCIEIWAWCGTPSWNGSSWNLKWFLPILNSDTHSNIFGSFARIFQFSKKYCSQVESFLFPLSEKDLVPKDAHVLTDTLVQSPENVFLVDVKLCWERFPSFLRKLLPNGL